LHRRTDESIDHQHRAFGDEADVRAPVAADPDLATGGGLLEVVAEVVPEHAAAHAMHGRPHFSCGKWS
jgi:hypothetical protein